MRDQYVGDISDMLKFGLLRALAANDRKLDIAWYYAPGHDGRARRLGTVSIRMSRSRFRICQNEASQRSKTRDCGLREVFFIESPCHALSLSLLDHKSRLPPQGSDDKASELPTNA
jgi:hypothetical protein